MAYTIAYYTPADEEQWDKFILTRSMNGTFLQTRKFINYHPQDRFIDRSLCIRKGSELVAVVLACEIMDEGKRTFFAHKGTTFGGISICRNVYTASAINEILASVGKQMNVSRVYIFENSLDNQFCSNTYEWCNEGVVPEIQNLQNIRLYQHISSKWTCKYC